MVKFVVLAKLIVISALMQRPAQLAQQVTISNTLFVQLIVEQDSLKMDKFAVTVKVIVISVLMGQPAQIALLITI